jgi:hypothetical protein
VRFAITRGEVKAVARSPVHDTVTRWPKVSGSVVVDPADPGEGAALELAVDMTAFDAGDFLRNRKLRKDLELARHPEARFVLSALEDVRDAGGSLRARARGQLRWRGTAIEIIADGAGRFVADGFSATAGFDLDVTRLGVVPPGLFGLRVADVVAVEVSIEGRALPEP